VTLTGTSKENSVRSRFSPDAQISLTVQTQWIWCVWGIRLFLVFLGIWSLHTQNHSFRMFLPKYQ